MASPADIREGLKTNLETITGVQVSAYRLANPTPPTLQIVPDEEPVEWDKAMQRGHDDWHYIIEAFVPFTNDINSQKLLDELLAGTGARSVKTQAESDKTLGGIVDSIRVERVDGFGVYNVNGADCLGCKFRVYILAGN